MKILFDYRLQIFTVDDGNTLVSTCQDMQIWWWKGKGIRRIAPQAATAAAAALLCQSGRTTYRPYRLISRLLDFDLRPNSHTQPWSAVCRLIVSSPVIHVMTWFTTQLPTPNGWKA